MSDIELGIGLGVIAAGVLTLIGLWAFASFVWPSPPGPPPPPPLDRG